MTAVLKKKTELFEHVPLPRAVLRLALPSVLGQAVLVLYNMADTFFVGMTGSDDMLAAVTVCTPAFMLLSAIANLFGVGGASLISRMLGARRMREAGAVSAFAIFGCLAVSLFYSIAVFAGMPYLLPLLGAVTPPVADYARTYLTVTVVGCGTFAAGGTLLSHLLRAEGNATGASLGVIAGGLLNIALDPLFMFVILPTGKEVLGAAIATGLSNACTLLFSLLLILREGQARILSFRPTLAMFRDGIPRGVLSAGLPAALMTLCENLSYAVLGQRMAAYGTEAQAGVGVAKKVNMLAHSAVRGMAQGVLPLIGYNFSSGDRRRMYRTVRLSARMSVGLSLLCTLVSLLFARQITGLFVTGTTSHAYSVTFLRILCVGAPFSAWAYTVISFFQATGHMGQSLLLALLRKGIADIPLMFWLGAYYGAVGTVAATPLSDLLCCLCAVVLFVVFVRRHPRTPPPIGSVRIPALASSRISADPPEE